MNKESRQKELIANMIKKSKEIKEDVANGTGDKMIFEEYDEMGRELKNEANFKGNKHGTNITRRTIH